MADPDGGEGEVRSTQTKATRFFATSKTTSLAGRSRRRRRRSFEARKARNSKSERTAGDDDEEWKFAHSPDIDIDGLGQVRESDYYQSAGPAPIMGHGSSEQ